MKTTTTFPTSLTPEPRPLLPTQALLGGGAQRSLSGTALPATGAVGGAAVTADWSARVSLRARTVAPATSLHGTGLSASDLSDDTTGLLPRGAPV